MPRSQQQIATLATGIKRATSPYLAGLFEIAAFPQAGRLTKISCGFPIAGPSKTANRGESHRWLVWPLSLL
jgi:hypothetical protein